MKKPVLLPFILLIATVENFSTDISLPAFPAMQAAFHVQQGAVELTVMYFLFGFAISPIFLGPIADRYGRRRVLLSCMASFFLASLMLFFSTSMNLIHVSRFIQGLSSGGFFVVNQAMIRDSYKGRQVPFVTAYVTVAWAFVALFAPLLGGYMETHYNWHAPFLVIVVYVSMLFLAIAMLLPETMHNTPRALSFRQVRGDMFGLFKQEKFMRLVSLATLTYSLLYIFYTVSPFLFESGYGFSVVRFSWFLFFSGCAYLLGGLSNMLLCRIVCTDTLLKTGLIGVSINVIFFSVCLIWCKGSALSIALPLIGMIYFSAFVFPNTLAMALSSQASSLATASAVYCSCQFLGCGFSSLITAKISHNSFIPIAVFMLFIVSCFPFVYRSSLKTTAINLENAW